MFRRVAPIAALAALSACSLLADFSYEQTSKITGGAIAGVMKLAGAFSKQAREPMNNTVLVKGDRMAHLGANQASVIDLGTETITTIDFQKKTYSVMTFAQMKQMLEQMSQKMKENDKGQMNFKVTAEVTGKSKQVAGLEAKEMVLKMAMEGSDKETGQKGAMVITTDMWMASGIAGYNEVREFQKRMAQKLSWNPSGGMMMNRPDIAKGMAEVAKEIAKLDGMPVLQTVIMGAEGQPGAGAPAGGEGTQRQQQQQPPAQQAERPSVGGALGGALGGRLGRLGGLGRSKKETPPPAEQPAPANEPPPQAAQSSGAPGSASLLEMTTELTNFSAGPVDSSKFEIPAGFKKVESEAEKMAR